jgi:hypothetical protein
MLLAGGHTSMPSLNPAFILPDICAVIALIVMIVKRRVPPDPPNPSNLFLNPPTKPS